MWKKDEIQGAETVSQHQAKPKPVVRSEPEKSGGPRDRATIGRSIKIKGDISGDEDLFVQGSVEGSVNLKEHHVTISSEGRVEADVHGRTITVQGQVEGDLFGEEQVILRPSCTVRGDITSPRVSLEDGANFRGTIDMETKAGKSTSATQQASAEKPSGQRLPNARTSDSSNVAQSKGKKL